MHTVFLFSLFALANTIVGYLIPSPPGRYNITLTTGTLIDNTRIDPYAATPTPRALMLSIFRPSTCTSTFSVPYMPNKTAEYQGSALQETFNTTADFAPLFLEARMQVCTHHADSSCSFNDGPILLFSTSYSIPRFYYNFLASALASEGFTVITIDHPYDANIIEYPDGRAVYNNASILNNVTWDLYPRAADASFIIDQLANATVMAELFPHHRAQAFATDRIAMLGHSAGGATAIIAASQDSRIRAAVNWDGTIIGSPPLSAVLQPVLFITHDLTTDPSWLDAWPQLRGPKAVLRVANTTHQTFSDLPTLLEADGQSTLPFADLLGTIAPNEMVRILTTYTTTWMNTVFTDNGEGALLPPEPGTFPEVSTLIKDNI